MSKLSKKYLDQKNLEKILNKKFNQGLQLHQTGHFSKARLIYQEILNLQPLNPDALHLMGLSDYFLQNYESALKLISDAININPHVADFYSNRGLVFHANKDHENALKDYERSIAIRPNFAQAYANKGLVLLEQKNRGCYF